MGFGLQSWPPCNPLHLLQLVWQMWLHRPHTRPLTGVCPAHGVCTCWRHPLYRGSVG